MKKLKQIKEDVKKKFQTPIEVSPVEYVGTHVALGVTAGVALGLGAILLDRQAIGKQVYERLLNGEVLERAVEKGAKVLIIKMVNPGEEVCACELH